MGVTRRAQLAGVFSGLALLLAAIGLYGVVAYSVSLRTNEMGIRLALGAVPSKVWRLVLRDNLGMVVAGLGLGLLFWVPLQGLVRNLVFGLSPRDPATLRLDQPPRQVHRLPVVFAAVIFLDVHAETR